MNEAERIAHLTAMMQASLRAQTAMSGALKQLLEKKLLNDEAIAILRPALDKSIEEQDFINDNLPKINLPQTSGSA